MDPTIVNQESASLIINDRAPALVRMRSNSINVASVIRGGGGGGGGEGDSDDSLSSAETSQHDELLACHHDDVDDDCPDDQDIQIKKKKKEVRQHHHRHRRRNSLNVASLLRSRANRGGDLDLLAPTTTCVVVDNNNATISSDVDEEMGLMYNKNNDDNVRDPHQRQQRLPQVQLNIDTYISDSDDDGEGQKTVLRHREVTFGAYYDDQNGEMIPELVQANARSRDDDDDEYGEAKEHGNYYYYYWIVVVLLRRLRKNVASARPHPAIQFVSTVAACLMAYAVINNRQPNNLDAQIATMTLVTLCGSTFPHLIAAVACGVYAGSVNSETIGGYYPWVLLLGFITALVWQFVSSFGIILGFSGRLGASAFIAMNITALVVFSIDPAVSFEKYGSLERLWGETPSLEEALSSLLACVFLASTAGCFRLISTIPVNPVLVPSAWALFCMLVTSVMEFRYTSSVLQGFAVGAYAAMASEARVPSTARFAIVGLIAGVWNIFLWPFFLGFGGKAGFTSMLGYSTYLLFKTFYKKQLKRLIGKARAGVGMKSKEGCNADDDSGEPLPQTTAVCSS